MSPAQAPGQFGSTSSRQQAVGAVSGQPRAGAGSQAKLSAWGWFQAKKVPQGLQNLPGAEPEQGWHGGAWPVSSDTSPSGSHHVPCPAEEERDEGSAFRRQELAALGCPSQCCRLSTAGVTLSHQAVLGRVGILLLWAGEPVPSHFPLCIWQDDSQDTQ